MCRGLLPSLCTASFGLSSLTCASALGPDRIVAALLYLYGCGNLTFLSMGARVELPLQVLTSRCWTGSWLHFGGDDPQGGAAVVFSGLWGSIICIANDCVEEV